MEQNIKASVIIPTHNAAVYLPILLETLQNQTLSHELIILDSESNDATRSILTDAGINYTSIKKADFNHGATRNLGLKLAKYETVIFLTQDALPAYSDTLEKIEVALYCDSKVAMAYGRQLPNPGIGIFGQFARLTNYPERSLLKNRELIPTMGIKTCSCSNSFAAYKKSTLLNFGGFPENIILGEDVSVAAQFILSDLTIAYCAEACVYHSHDYTLLEEFKRYFDIGVFHQQQQAVLAEFTKAESEGIKYVLEESRYIVKAGKPHKLIVQYLRTIAKYAGYKAGLIQNIFPKNVKKRFSMHKSFWE